MKFSRLMWQEYGPCPCLHVIPWHLLKTEEKSTKKTSVGVVEKCQLGTIQCVNMTAFAGSQTSFRSRSSCFSGPGSTLGQCRCMKGFPTSSNFELNISEIRCGR